MIVDEQYYTDKFKGTLVPVEQLSRLLETASYDIHRLTFNRSLNPAKLSAFQLNLVQRATCHQAEHIHARNDVSGLNIKSMGSDGSSVSYAPNETTRYSGYARDLITSSGLNYAGFY